MRIVPGGATSGIASTAPAGEVAKSEAPAAAAASSGGKALQSAVLQPAIAALDALPDIDHAKVAALRDALAKGELPFDAGKLAALIESYHRAGGSGRNGQ